MTKDFGGLDVAYVTVGNREVVHSGVAISYQNLPVIIFLRNGLVVEIAFANTAGGSPALNTKSEGKRFRLICTNFENALGEGPTYPITLPFAFSSSDQLGLLFTSHFIGAGTRVVHYTLLNVI